MPITARCPKCDWTAKVADQFQGKKVRCKPCGAAIVVTGDARPSAAPTPVKAAAPARPKAQTSGRPAATRPPARPKPRQTSLPPPETIRKVRLIVGLAAVGVVVLAIGVGLAGTFLMMAEDNKPAPTQANTNPPPPPDEPDGWKPRVAWNLQPDPSRFQSSGQWDVKTEIPGNQVGPLAFPCLDSPYVGLWSADPKFPGHLQVYDLRTMKPVGVPLEGRFGDGCTLSADGKYVASKGDWKLLVQTVADGKLLHSFDVPRNVMEIGLMDFPGVDLFITEMHDAASSDIRVWDLKTGQEAFKIDSPVENFSWRWSVITPGGKYLVMQATTNVGYTLHCWEIATGQIAGELELLPKETQWGQASGFAFTPDCKQMSILWQVNKGFWAKLYTWDFATGKKVSEHTLPTETGLNNLASRCGVGTFRDLQWLPDGSGWMVSSHAVLERDTGKEVARIEPIPPAVGSQATRKLLDANHVAILGAKGTFRVEPLPRKDIDEKIKQVREQHKPQ